MLEVNKLVKTLGAAILLINLANGLDDISMAFGHEKTIQVAKYLHEELKGTGPYLINGVSINPDEVKSILDGMDELYKVFSIAITFSYPDSLSKKASTEKYQLGPLGIIERELSEFETFYRNNENLVNGARVAVILVLNPMDPLSLDKLKNILAQQSVVYAFSANVSEHPNFEPGNIITRKST